MWFQKKALSEVKVIEKTEIEIEKLYYRTNKYAYNFQNFWTIKTFLTV